MPKARLKEHRIDRNWCKGCGICVHFCPKDVLVLDGEDKAVAARPKDCIACKMCELRCPDLAIEVVLEGQDEDESVQSVSAGGAHGAAVSCGGGGHA